MVGFGQVVSGRLWVCQQSLVLTDTPQLYSWALTHGAGQGPLTGEVLLQWQKDWRGSTQILRESNLLCVAPTTLVIEGAVKGVIHT